MTYLNSEQMNEFIYLFSIKVEHEFYVHLGSQQLYLSATKESADAIRTQGLHVLPIDDGLEIWQEKEFFLRQQQDYQLSFDVSSADPWYAFRTDWNGLEANAVWRAQENKLCAVVVLNESRLLFPSQFAERLREKNKALFCVMVDHPKVSSLENLKNEKLTEVQYFMSLRSKKIHWKYFFTGSLAQKKLHIMDLNAKENEQSLSFVYAARSENRTHNIQGVALISQQAIAMQAQSMPRFQLREEGVAGVAGKILIKHLPNPTMQAFGKDRGNDGRESIVAEIYIHQ
jgi:hypothetical protein